MDVLSPNQTSPHVFRKRKAENLENNERLSKRLSLLNLERDRHKLYIPVGQQPTALTKTQLQTPPPPPQSTQAPSSNSNLKSPLSILGTNSDLMQIDDSKHKVYIYDLDAEILDPEPDKNKLVFLPDIEKHLLECRIPSSVIPSVHNTENKQLVLYNVPGSLTVPEEQDSVRRAIIETRARAQAKHEASHSHAACSQLIASHIKNQIIAPQYDLVENIDHSNLDEMDVDLE